MKFPVKSLLAGNFGLPETGSLETASSRRESCELPVPRALWRVVEPGWVRGPSEPRLGDRVEVVKGLWDGWDDGALLLEKASGRYFDEAKSQGRSVRVA